MEKAGKYDVEVCPVCGSAPLILRNDTQSEFCVVTCPTGDCEFYNYNTYEGVENAVAGWNDMCREYTESKAEEADEADDSTETEQSTEDQGDT